MLTPEGAYQVAKKAAYAKANGATREQASKFCGNDVCELAWNSISPIIFEKSPKHINGWVEAQ